MPKKIIASGALHKIPADLQRSLSSNQIILTAWNNLTPLGRNEWICWVTSVKKSETREQHIKRACTEITEGKRRPCCWPGCPHRQKIN